MKRLCANFQRSRPIFSVGLLAAVTSLFLSLPAAALHAGQVLGPPGWFPLEIDAINLYESGIYQMKSNRQGAQITLRQARKDSVAAIADGGGANPAVLHNDWLISQALLAAQVNAVETPQDNNTAPDQASGGNNPARPSGTHIQPVFKLGQFLASNSGRKKG